MGRQSSSGPTLPPSLVPDSLVLYEALLQAMSSGAGGRLQSALQHHSELFAAASVALKHNQLNVSMATAGVCIMAALLKVQRPSTLQQPQHRWAVAGVMARFPGHNQVCDCALQLLCASSMLFLVLVHASHSTKRLSLVCRCSALVAGY